MYFIFYKAHYNMTESLLLLTGSIGCGKSTIANILVNEFGYHEITFAEPIKKIGELLGFSHDQMFGTQDQKLQINEFWNISGRHFLQTFGSEVMREYLPKAIPQMNMNNSSVWVRVAEQQLLKYKRVVISDGRFLDEVEMVKKNNGFIINIVREKQDDENKSINDHKSENSLRGIKYDIIINNNNTIEHLHANISCVVNIIDNINNFSSSTTA